MNTTTPIPIITVIGKSKSGKTTLLVRMIAELKRRGYHVGTIKHHSHRGFEIDKPGKDSWKHAQAGSEHVVIAAPDKLAAYRLLRRELSLDEIAAEMHGLDIILVEGYKSAGKPAIEVVQAGITSGLIGDPGQCFAIVSDRALDNSIPQFTPGEASKVVDLVERRFLHSEGGHA